MLKSGDVYAFFYVSLLLFYCICNHICIETYREGQRSGRDIIRYRTPCARIGPGGVDLMSNVTHSVFRPFNNQNSKGGPRALPEKCVGVGDIDNHSGPASHELGSP